jgi:hypothetical protein
MDYRHNNPVWVHASNYLTDIHNERPEWQDLDWDTKMSWMLHVGKVVASEEWKVLTHRTWDWQARRIALDKLIAMSKEIGDQIQCS